MPIPDEFIQEPRRFRSEYSGEALTAGDAEEIIYNVKEFFDLVARWANEGEERKAAQAQPDQGLSR